MALTFYLFSMNGESMTYNIFVMMRVFIMNLFSTYVLFVGQTFFGERFLYLLFLKNSDRIFLEQSSSENF